MVLPKYLSNEECMRFLVMSALQTGMSIALVDEQYARTLSSGLSSAEDIKSAGTLIVNAHPVQQQGAKDRKDAQQL
jgi:hypothetical protein